METSKAYRQLAAESLRIADAMASAADRAALLSLAQIWHRMAKEKEHAAALAASQEGAS
jgi:hypothetical protein